MIKNKNTPTLRYKITTLFGYILFGLIALSYLITIVIPMTFALQNPDALHFNIIIFIVMFGVAIIIPALTAYFIGDKSTLSRNSAVHRYNGVLFGFAAYWVAMFMSWIGASTMFGLSKQLYSFLLIGIDGVLVILTIVIMIILAVFFSKYQKNSTSLLQFLPYQLILTVSMIGTFASPYISSNPYDSLVSITTVVIIIFVTAIAYFVLNNQKMSRLARLTDAFIATSIGWIAVWVAEMFLSYLQLSYQVTTTASYVIGLIVMGIYLYLRVRYK